MEEKESTGDVCLRKSALFCCSFAWQIAVALVFVGASLWIVAYGLESLHVIGVSGVPPGLNYAPWLHSDGSVYRT